MTDPLFDMQGTTDNAELAADRARSWDAFTEATKYSVIAIAGLLVVIYLIWG